MKGLTIGQLARELRLNPKTIRYYEEVGLLPEPRRSESGYRLYSPDEVERLRLVKRAKLLGLSLAEIKGIVDYAVNGHCDTLHGHLLSLIETKLGEIDQQIKDLGILREDLRRYHTELARWSGAGIARSDAARTADSCQCVGQEVDRIGRGTEA